MHRTPTKSSELDLAICMRYDELGSLRSYMLALFDVEFGTVCSSQCRLVEYEFVDLVSYTYSVYTIYYIYNDPLVLMLYFVVEPIPFNQDAFIPQT